MRINIRYTDEILDEIVDYHFIKMKTPKYPSKLEIDIYNDGKIYTFESLGFPLNDMEYLCRGSIHDLFSELNWGQESVPSFSLGGNLFKLCSIEEEL